VTRLSAFSSVTGEADISIDLPETRRRNTKLELQLRFIDGKRFVGAASAVSTCDLSGFSLPTFISLVKEKALKRHHCADCCRNIPISLIDKVRAFARAFESPKSVPQKLCHKRGPPFAVMGVTTGILAASQVPPCGLVFWGK